MNTETEPHWQRLLPLSIVFNTWQALKGFAVPIVVLALGGRSHWSGWISEVQFYLLMMALVMLGGLLRYWTLRYRLAHDALQVREGLLHRSQRHIPLERIQNVRLYQSLLHRLLNVVELQVETAGAQQQAEARLAVLRPDEAEALRLALLRRPDQTVQQAATPVLHHLDTEELIRLGLIQNRGWVVIALGMGVLGQLLQNSPPDLLLNLPRRWVPDLLQQTPDHWLELVYLFPLWQTVLAMLMALLVFWLLIWLLSVALALARFHGFTLSREGDNLRIRQGLFSRFDGQLPLKRIQAVSLYANPMHRLFGRVSLKARTAGDASMQQQTHLKVNWLLPLATPAQAEALLHQLYPRVNWQGEYQPLHRGAGWRLALQPGLAAPLWLLLDHGVAGMALVGLHLALVSLLARRQARAQGWRLDEHGLHLRQGLWFQRRHFIPLDRIQVLGLRQNPLDRLADMASIRPDVAGSTVFDSELLLRLLPRRAAESLRQRLAEEAARRPFVW